LAPVLRSPAAGGTEDGGGARGGGGSIKGEELQEKRLFEPGDLVKTFTGQIGVVMSLEEFEEGKARFREGRRPGYYFAPGCCAHPDYVTQVPVFFEDGTYDVMKAMNIRKKSDVPAEKIAKALR
jgi:hypothetical protein